ncbi:MAG: hypothetical protein ABIO70_11635 [Pseudomonadota bacterium]
MIILFILGVFALVGLAMTALVGFMIYQSVQRKGRWGINVKRTDCPRCGWKLPAVRKPTSLRQALWGGWTCQQCGAELDKWGQAIEEG